MLYYTFPNVMHIIFCLAFVLVSAVNAYSQAFDTRQRFIALGANVNYQQFQDVAVSPLRYAGLSYGGFLGVTSFGGNERFQVNVSICPVGTFTATTPDKSASKVNLQFLANASISYGWRIPSPENNGWGIYLGPAIHFTGHFKSQSEFSNSALSFDFYTSFAAMARVERDFSETGLPLILGTQATMPLVGWMLRPYYATTTKDFSGQNGGLLGIDNRIMWLGTFPMLSWRTDLNYILTSGNRLGIGYEWEYYSTEYLNPVQAARHGAYLYLQTKL
jgi:hypothetical protein